MILIYATVDGEELDQVTITMKSVRYATGRARDVLAPSLRRFGRAWVMSKYRDWSNGYVKISERV